MEMQFNRIAMGRFRCARRGWLWKFCMVLGILFRKGERDIYLDSIKSINDINKRVKVHFHIIIDRNIK